MSLSHSFAVIDALMAVLDEEHAHAVVDHRRALRKPLTLHAARLLAKQFALCANPNEGADEMIMRGWQGFKPEWIRDRNIMAVKPQPRTMAEYTRTLLDTIEHESNSHH